MPAESAQDLRREGLAGRAQPEVEAGPVAGQAMESGRGEAETALR